jgi:transcriptional regulator with XRE-family HTH domain
MDNPGYHIRELREAASLTQEKLAAQCGVTSQTIANIENKRKPAMPRISTLRKIAAGLGVDVARLLEDAPASAA